MCFLGNILWGLMLMRDVETMPWKLCPRGQRPESIHPLICVTQFNRPRIALMGLVPCGGGFYKRSLSSTLINNCLVIELGPITCTCECNAIHLGIVIGISIPQFVLKNIIICTTVRYEVKRWIPQNALQGDWWCLASWYNWEGCCLSTSNWGDSFA